MTNDNYKHTNTTSIIIGAAMKVHNTLGMGYPEKIYHNALIIELKKYQDLFVESEVESDVYYEQQWVGTRRLDLLINKEILIELKAVSEIENRFISQTLNYLEMFNIEVGLLINFGKDKVEFKRFYNKKYIAINKK